jgi:septation ring formation regulator EzrA
MNQITEKAKELKIIINPKKTKITKISRSFIFLQFKYYLTDDGHVVVRINPKTVTRMRRKLKKLKVKYLAGEVRFIKIKSLFQSWIANYSKYMSKIQTKHMVKLY